MNKLNKKNKVQSEKCIRDITNYFTNIKLDNNIAIHVLEVLLVNCFDNIILHTASIDLLNKFIKYKFGDTHD